jgi:RHS repeat-associated protein
MEVDLSGSTVTETRTHYSFGGLPVAVRTHEADETTFVFTDHLGSVTSTWNDTTDTLTLTRYFPYGGERHSSGEMPQDQRYTGQTSDATANASGGSGLLYYNARYYDPATAQFTQPDTIVPDPATPADLNRYSYVRGNPLRYTDPSGHCTEEAYGIPCEADLTPDRIVDAYIDAVEEPPEVPELPWWLEAALDASDWLSGTTFGQFILVVAENPWVYFPGYDCAKLSAWCLADFVPFVGKFDEAAGILKRVSAAGDGVRASGQTVVRSTIKNDRRLVREAGRLGADHQRSVDALTTQLAKGNLNPGSGTRLVFGDVFEARARDGARVYFRRSGNTITVVGKSTKANQGRVISILKDIYG